MKGHAITKEHMSRDEAKAIRQRLGWTLEHTARELGVEGGRTNYWQFENGFRQFTFTQAELLRAYDAGYRRKDVTNETATGRGLETASQPKG